MEETKAKEILNDAVSIIISRFADHVEVYAVEDVERRKLIAWGNLRKAIHVKTSGDIDEGFHILCYAEGSLAPYAGYVHEGITPHMPPIAPLIAWVKKKGLGKGDDKTDIENGRVDRTRIRWTKRKGMVVNQDDIKAFRKASSIAWAIAKKIEKEGIPEKPFFYEAVKKAIAEL